MTTVFSPPSSAVSELTAELDADESRLSGSPNTYLWIIYSDPE